ncbi:hypothetical protein [Streptomyces albus]|uniref:hypothetical protein n=1 Tax=Streptomyces albus TaxID=1888 RepID=UPI0034011CAE
MSSHDGKIVKDDGTIQALLDQLAENVSTVQQAEAYQRITEFADRSLSLLPGSDAMDNAKALKEKFAGVSQELAKALEDFIEGLNHASAVVKTASELADRSEDAALEMVRNL